ncbi:CBS domain-containing protein [Sporosarcina sp. GW1-11]|uniref:CBS domain-containing protein n=1 Tax=Sporosarcina sp. GW1-11 TaxID=2899126 RepID=UPI00294D397C|nr:CBS domain-containing protein [Sporosarcina sp. GW1-11]MDV6378742.1 CBS domain-containing protein [Sporosarcina sp. GW1-11]
MPKNSERFLVAYNRIDKSLMKITDLPSHLSFAKKVDKAKQQNALVAHYEDDLKEFGSLRNAIVHNRTGLDYAIAEPHDVIVELIELIDEKLSHPVTVKELFERKVHTLQAHESLAVALKLVREKKFNQLPIYEKGRFIGLITADGIMNWLAGQYTEDICLEIPTLLDIHNHEKRKKTYRFVKSTMSVYEAEGFFKKSISSGNRLEALLITEQGGKDEKLIGIITPLDLLKLD